jgi:hypothetical protein
VFILFHDSETSAGQMSDLQWSPVATTAASPEMCLWRSYLEHRDLATVENLRLAETRASSEELSDPQHSTYKNMRTTLETGRGTLRKFATAIVRLVTSRARYMFERSPIRARSPRGRGLDEFLRAGPSHFYLPCSMLRPDRKHCDLSLPVGSAAHITDKATTGYIDTTRWLDLSEVKLANQGVLEH